MSEVNRLYLPEGWHTTDNTTKKLTSPNDDYAIASMDAWNTVYRDMQQVVGGITDGLFLEAEESRHGRKDHPEDRSYPLFSALAPHTPEGLIAARKELRDKAIHYAFWPVQAITRALVAGGDEETGAAGFEVLPENIIRLDSYSADDLMPYGVTYPPLDDAVKLLYEQRFIHEPDQCKPGFKRICVLYPTYDGAPEWNLPTMLQGLEVELWPVPASHKFEGAYVIGVGPPPFSFNDGRLEAFRDNAVELQWAGMLGMGEAEPWICAKGRPRFEVLRPWLIAKIV